ncbi:PTS fructose transporter subunit IIBC [Candidatus Erwinia haradaeae]|uniref:protein-N(pi)-phosphohistidine--D-fructose phosphotransferase n=1 Tax=Candidatus Erwinia haradaeae TaxID=1922217 RepID=A0A451D2F9_9GAMM|nr:PTS fructose transporter subunit IIBC [Candidatus Erwinia haradaeae]VFP79829.1 PTS system fructose-specific EIIB'BC component [Candidatus Erwinia haradaeae]
MKHMLMIDSSIGCSISYIAKKLFIEAANRANILITNNITEAELVLILSTKYPVDEQLHGKLVYVIDIKKFIINPANILLQTSLNAQLYQPSTSDFTIQKKQPDKIKKVLAVTACPTGVAHTFMAAEAINNEAHKRGWWIKVETRGSLGTKNSFTENEISDADFIIVATDIEVDLSKFVGKRIYKTSTGLALKNTAQELDNACFKAKPYSLPMHQTTSNNEDNQNLHSFYRHLMTGISYMLPMVITGGLITALAFAISNSFHESNLLINALMQIGSRSALILMIPVLSGYIAFSMADRPGLAPGLIGGMLAVNINAGFLGGMISGFMSGYIVQYLNAHIHMPKNMESLKPLLILPIIASLLTGLLMIYVIGTPIAEVMFLLTSALNNLGTTNSILLGAVLGGMMCIDIGGPLNKIAYAFGIGLLSSKTYTPMAAIMAAGIIPPLSMGVTTLIMPHKFNYKERVLGKTAIILGICFISEGAIPFAIRDPMRVLPCCVIGGAVTGGISMAIGAKLIAPHGGLLVLLMPGVITPVLGYLMAIIIGTLITSISYAILKSPNKSL